MAALPDRYFTQKLGLVLLGSRLLVNSQIAGYAIRTSGGQGGGLSDVAPYPHGAPVGFSNGILVGR